MEGKGVSGGGPQFVLNGRCPWVVTRNRSRVWFPVEPLKERDEHVAHPDPVVGFTLWASLTGYIRNSWICAEKSITARV